MPRPRRAFWNNAIRPSDPRRSFLGYRHAGCLQLSHRRPPDLDPPRFLARTVIGGGIRSRRPRERYLVLVTYLTFLTFFKKLHAVAANFHFVDKIASQSTHLI